MITLALLACFALVGLLSYAAGADDGDRRAWHAHQVADQYSAAMAPSRHRHPSSQGVDPRLVVDDEISEARS